MKKLTLALTILGFISNYAVVYILSKVTTIVLIPLYAAKKDKNLNMIIRIIGKVIYIILKIQLEITDHLMESANTTEQLMEIFKHRMEIRISVYQYENLVIDKI